MQGLYFGEAEHAQITMTSFIFGKNVQNQTNYSSHNVYICKNKDITVIIHSLSRLEMYEKKTNLGKELLKTT